MPVSTAGTIGQLAQLAQLAGVIALSDCALRLNDRK